LFSKVEQQIQILGGRKGGREREGEGEREREKERKRGETVCTACFGRKANGAMMESNQKNAQEEKGGRGNIMRSENA
jgi:hypothetical protein